MLHPKYCTLSLLLSVSVLFSSLTVHAKVSSYYPTGILEEKSLKQSTLKEFKNAKGTTRSEHVDPRANDKQWAHKDLKEDKVIGTSTLKSYRDLNLKTPQKPLIVAVIDSGVDINHEDLKGMIWKNEKEIPNNGKDDDGNGYIDDVNGWNFLGNKKGENVNDTTLEVTREMVRLTKIVNSGKTLSKDEQKYFDLVKQTLNKELNRVNTGLTKFQTRLAQFLPAKAALIKDGFNGEWTIQNLLQYKPKSLEASNALESIHTLAMIDQRYIDEAFLNYAVDYYKKAKIPLDVNTPDASILIGDNPKIADDIGYGNNDVKGPDAHHGTHCAGIIGALRGNGKGMDGQTNFIKIMPIRAVPNGDERDKDVGNAIFYAVNNGAKIISMSFGKSFNSPLYSHVQKAIQYAKTKGVLLVHAAGNDSQNNDVSKNFPNSREENFIEVGASSPFTEMETLENDTDVSLAADFTNYGKKSVDLFAPGVSIYSSIPMSADGKNYDYFDGTSMATPEVAGVAALVLSQKSTLTAKDLKSILMSTTTQVNQPVYLPIDNGIKPTVVPFSDLSVTGGIVNAYEALLKIGVSKK